ncbi:MAG: hypothetical protein FWG64_02385 [Firmicutes bacterium]|nr:hypothetical protein [Bacillota bacterium]
MMNLLTTGEIDINAVMSNLEGQSINIATKISEVGEIAEEPFATLNVGTHG